MQTPKNKAPISVPSLTRNSQGMQNLQKIRNKRNGKLLIE